MRLIAEGIKGDFVSENLVPGGRKMAWRQLPLIARFRNEGTGSCAFTIFNGITDETIDFNSISATSGISSIEFESPGSYRVEIGSVVGDVELSIYMDGDTGNASAGAKVGPITTSGYDSGFDGGYG